MSLVINDFARYVQICLQRRDSHLENILDKIYLFSKPTKITNTSRDDRTKAEVYANQVP